MSWTAVRTVAVLELRQRVRSTRWRVMLVVWGVVLVLLCGGLTALAGMSGGRHEEIVPILYDLTLGFVLGIGLIVAPTLSATSINGDRADATLALLQATALRSHEIVVGKLLAAWLAALAFLAVAAPFLLAFTMTGGASWTALAGHLLILAVSLGAVCAVGLGLSAATARPSASAVLTYLVVTALVIGTPIMMTLSTTAVHGKQRSIVYSTDYDESTNNKQVCEKDPDIYTSDIVHWERIWWMLVPNPFVALGDVSARAPVTDIDPRTSYSPLRELGLSVDTMRTPQPAEVVSYYCGNDSHSTWDDDVRRPEHLVFWPATLLVLGLLGAWSLVSASRRLRTPVRTLARGTRVA
ncbi:ABC transporter permease [Actinomyces dentalis]|uniref:ABC transporter permease n=1 Tax=Actinomyces dentalis TaxID=272548 RepID=UPI00235786B8|nr:ABC transporter permease subunit [Actinomyces dentalis]